MKGDRNHICSVSATATANGGGVDLSAAAVGGADCADIWATVSIGAATNSYALTCDQQAQTHSLLSILIRRIESQSKACLAEAKEAKD